MNVIVDLKLIVLLVKIFCVEFFFFILLGNIPEKGVRKENRHGDWHTETNYRRQGQRNTSVTNAAKNSKIIAISIWPSQNLFS